MNSVNKTSLTTMETIKFKTDIKCSGCVAKVTPHLNKELGEGNWKVDTSNSLKILSVPVNSDEAKIREAVQMAGFKSERL